MASRKRTPEQEFGCRRSPRRQRTVGCAFPESSERNIPEDARNELENITEDVRKERENITDDPRNQSEDITEDTANQFQNITEDPQERYRRVSRNLNFSLSSQSLVSRIGSFPVSTAPQQSNRQTNMLSQQRNVFVSQRQYSSSSNPSELVRSISFSPLRSLQRGWNDNLISHQRNLNTFEERSSSSSNERHWKGNMILRHMNLFCPSKNPSVRSGSSPSQRALQNDGNSEVISHQRNPIFKNALSLLNQSKSVRTESSTSPKPLQSDPNGDLVSQQRNPFINDEESHGSDLFSKRQIEEAVKGEFSCSVCLDLCYEPSTLTCGHSFCKPCLVSSINNCGNRCPNCRKNVIIDVEGPSTNTAMWNIIKLFFPAKVEERKKAIMEDERSGLRNQRLDGNYLRYQRQGITRSGTFSNLEIAFRRLRAVQILARARAQFWRNTGRMQYRDFDLDAELARRIRNIEREARGYRIGPDYMNILQNRTEQEFERNGHERDRSPHSEFHDGTAMSPHDN